MKRDHVPARAAQSVARESAHFYLLLPPLLLAAETLRALALLAAYCATHAYGGALFYRAIEKPSLGLRDRIAPRRPAEA